MKTRIFAAMAVLAFAAPAFAGGPHYSSGPSYTPELLPPSNNPGECWARVKVPAKYETVTQTVMTHGPYQTTKVSQPKFQSRQEQVMVKEPSVRYEVRQPTFKTVSEQIMTRPEYDKLSVTPPRFSTVTEKLTMSEPKLVWKKGNPGDLKRQGYIIHSTADGGHMGQGYSSTTQYGHSGGTACGDTCEIWCLVEEPGVQQSYTRRVMSDPGGVQRHRVPARYQTITKQVVSDPGGVREVHVPGEYRTVTVEDLVDPGGEYSENVPPQYGNVQSKVMAETERYEWRRVVCKPGTGSMGSSYSSGGYSSGGYSSGGSYSSGSTYGSGHAYSSGGYTSGHSGSMGTTHSSGHHSSGHYIGSVYRQPHHSSGTLAGAQRHLRKRHSYYR